MSFAVSALMSRNPHLPRIPTDRIDKARFYGAMAEFEMEARKLQSAETFFRLAVMMDPADPHLSDQLNEVTRLRAGQDSAPPAR